MCIFLYGIFPYSVVYCTEQKSMLHESIKSSYLYNIVVKKGDLQGKMLYINLKFAFSYNMNDDN